MAKQLLMLLPRVNRIWVILPPPEVIKGRATLEGLHLLSGDSSQAETGRQRPRKSYSSRGFEGVV